MTTPPRPRPERMTEEQLKTVAADVYDEINALGSRRALDALMAEVRRARAAESRMREALELAESALRYEMENEDLFLPSAQWKLVGERIRSALAPVTTARETEGE